MQASPLSPSWFALLCVCASQLLGCSRDEPPPKGPDWLHEREASPSPPPPKPFVSPLDSYGNLKGRGETIMGFERPFASREADHRSKVPVYYLMANEERMLRFFRSRGHVVIETGTGWRFEHSDRTLGALSSPDEAERFKDAKIYARQGPGAGWTLIFDDGRPIETATLPLLQLLDEVTPSPQQKGGKGAESVAKPGEAAPDGRAQSAPSRGKLSGRSLRKLERAALKRSINKRRAKDVSARIYKHAKKRGQRFLD